MLAIENGLLAYISAWLECEPKRQNNEKINVAWPSRVGSSRPAGIKQAAKSTLRHFINSFLQK
jgi:hypothetical protein